MRKLKCWLGRHDWQLGVVHRISDNNHLHVYSCWWCGTMKHVQIGEELCGAVQALSTREGGRNNDPVGTRDKR